MTTFDLHIMRRLLTGYVYLIVSLIVFFIVLHYVEYIDDFMDRGATMKEVFLVYYPSYIPEIVRLTSPLALFLSCVYLTGRLAQKLQLAALQTSGVSLYRILVPYAAVALIVTGFMFWFNGWIVPESNRVVIDFEQRYLKNSKLQLDVNNIHRQDSPNGIITVGYYDRHAQIAHRISLQHFSGTDRLIERIDAERMEWNDSLKTWHIVQGVVRSFEDREARRVEFTERDTTLTILPRDFARTEREVESMTLPDARGYIQSLLRSGASNTGRSLVQYHSKFSYPFVNLIVVLMGVPLAAVRRRGGQAVQLGIGLFIAFLYLTAMKLIEPFGFSGELSPHVTAWLPHLFFLTLSVLLLVRARK